MILFARPVLLSFLRPDPTPFPLPGESPTSFLPAAQSVTVWFLRLSSVPLLGTQERPGRLWN
jgi:hypothetical protein